MPCWQRWLTWISFGLICLGVGVSLRTTQKVRLRTTMHATLTMPPVMMRILMMTMPWVMMRILMIPVMTTFRSRLGTLLICAIFQPTLWPGPLVALCYYPTYSLTWFSKIMWSWSPSQQWLKQTTTFSRSGRSVPGHHRINGGRPEDSRWFTCVCWSFFCVSTCVAVPILVLMMILGWLPEVEPLWFKWFAGPVQCVNTDLLVTVQKMNQTNLKYGTNEKMKGCVFFSKRAEFTVRGTVE